MAAISFPTNRWIVFGHHFRRDIRTGTTRRTYTRRAIRIPPRALWIIVGVAIGGACRTA